MEATSLRLYSDGTVTIGGRLDLNVLAMTGQIGVNPDALKLAGLQLPTVGPIPVTMIVRVSNALSNRIIRLHVGGTFRSPTVQVNGAALLSDAAVRFFLNSSGFPRP